MESVGIIYGSTSSTRFDVALSDSRVHRLDYLRIEHDQQAVLCQVEDVVRKGSMSYDEAVLSTETGEDKLSASVQVIGFMDPAGRVKTPRTPFAAGQHIGRADERLVNDILGLGQEADGAYIGHIANSTIPVRLSINMLAQKHVSVLAKTGAGKSYTVGVLLEEFLAADVPLVILDPHGEYGSLRHANIEAGDIERMVEYGVRPRSFNDKVHEWALDTQLNPDAEKLRLEGINLEGREIVDLLGGKLSGGQVGLLYQAVKEVKDNLPGYTLQDIMDVVQLNKSASKWNVINALEALEGTGLFHISGTEIKELVQPGQCTIINLKGVAPDVQEVAVTRLTGMLWEARKRNEVPPFIFVCEEAHNFCPERGVGNAISGGIIRTVASEGRKFGMGLVIVSQRPAKIDKNVLSQCNTQFVLKVTNPNDLKAIISSVEGITGKAGDEVQRLPIGTALIAGGGLTQPVFVDIRPRVTNHGGRSIDVIAARKTIAKRQASPVDVDAAPRRRSSRSPANSSAIPTVTRTAEPEPPSVDSAAGEIVAPGVRSTGPRASARQSTPSVNSVVNSQSSHHMAPTANLSGVSANPGASPAAASPLDGLEQRAAAQKPQPSPKWSPKDTPAIHRVAQRVGLVTGARDAESTIEFLSNLARQNGRNPDMRLGLYAEIGRKVCHVEGPSCIRCPLADSCQTHQSARKERRKSRSTIRRLWSR